MDYKISLEYICTEINVIFYARTKNNTMKTTKIKTIFAAVKTPMRKETKSKDGNLIVRINSVTDYEREQAKIKN